MILPLHIAIAVASLLLAGYGLLFPSRAKLIVNYVMIGLTLGTGTALIITSPEHMTTGCVAGCIYSVIMVAGAVVLRRRVLHAEAARA